MTYQHDIHGTRSLAHRSSGSGIGYMVIIVTLERIYIVAKHYVRGQIVPLAYNTYTERVFPSFRSTVGHLKFQLVTASHCARATSNHGEELGVVDILNSMDEFENLNKIAPSPPFLKGGELEFPESCLVWEIT